jgi:hypothetical protein
LLSLQENYTVQNPVPDEQENYFMSTSGKPETINKKLQTLRREIEEKTGKIPVNERVF